MSNNQSDMPKHQGLTNFAVWVVKDGFATAAVVSKTIVVLWVFCLLVSAVVTAPVYIGYYVETGALPTLSMAGPLTTFSSVSLGWQAVSVAWWILIFLGLRYLAWRNRYGR